MVRPVWVACVCALITGAASAQEYYGDVGSEPYLGAGSVGASEPLFPYDDQEQWKHGYLQFVPFYGGFHSGRPYNYHHVFAQTQTSVGWGMPHGLPYSQQWWHRFDAMGDPGRAMNEPNGYLGQAPAGEPVQLWTQAPGMLPSVGVAPVQYLQPLPSAPLSAPGVDPRTAPAQTQQLRQYLAAPAVY